MHYYRKTAAVFILVLTLILPLFLEKNEATAVVNLDRVIDASSYLSEIKARSSAEPEADQISLAAAESKIMEILKTEAAELAALNSYSSILIDQAIYQGGSDITQELAAKIDEKYK
ncbi:hypothetical protein C7957_11654 [Halanaerobium saccharolyticum]|jgi:hypothetical protein|uniref:Uncharacterized protein n=1 Tax=Halanaerobium saccharolyticum TaxID=43595 RepID=A0A4R6RXI1_9FIRM|nr:hypothetical protein [Halanaerobium saccharolyticum]TDP91771.1 hypothetical protein C7957_11654 [Halanaerobium saccharolyticum]